MLRNAMLDLPQETGGSLWHRSPAKASRISSRPGLPDPARASPEIQRKSCFSPQNGHGGRVQSLVISGGYTPNSLLVGSTKFSAGSTNSGHPNNRITAEFRRLGKNGFTARSAAGRQVRDTATKIGNRCARSRLDIPRAVPTLLVRLSRWR